MLKSEPLPGEAITQLQRLVEGKFEEQAAQLSQLVRREGHVSCRFLRSSPEPESGDVDPLSEGRRHSMFSHG